MTLAPITPSERLRGVDLARGVALLGILLVNVRMFFLPLGVAFDPSIVPMGLTPHEGDWIAWSLVEFFCTYKCISLFSILFGFGLAMQAERVVNSGGSRVAFGMRRLGTLAAIGLVHGTLVWYGDILTLYSILGVAVLAMARLSIKWIARVLLWIMVALTVLTLFFATVQWALRAHPEWTQGTLTREVVQSEAGSPESAMEPAAESPPATSPPPRGFAAMLATGFEIGNPIWLDAETAAYRDGPALDALVFRVVSFGFSVLAAFFGYGWHAFAMMLCGVYAFRTGLFLPDASARRHRIARVAFLIGVPMALLAVAPYWVFGVEAPITASLHVIGLELGGLTLPLGYAMLLVETGPHRTGVIARAIERAGRMALTVYLCESLVCVTLASWWGFGWFGSMLDLKFSCIALAVWSALVVGANLWIARFGVGPMERMWRRVSYAARSE